MFILRMSESNIRLADIMCNSLTSPVVMYVFVEKRLIANANVVVHVATVDRHS